MSGRRSLRPGPTVTICFLRAACATLVAVPSGPEDERRQADHRHDPGDPNRHPRLVHLLPPVAPGRSHRLRPCAGGQGPVVTGVTRSPGATCLTPSSRQKQGLWTLLGLRFSQLLCPATDRPHWPAPPPLRGQWPGGLGFTADYWPSSQPASPARSAASRGPQEPFGYTSGSGLSRSSPPATSHTWRRPSGRVKSERSPRSTSWMSRA